MSKGIVIYASNYGNTEKVARALAEGLEKGGVDVDCINIDEVDADKLGEYSIVAMGGPTHIAAMSKPMKEFLEALSGAKLKGVKGFAFDTRNPSRFNALDINSAARRIEGKMKKMKVKMIRRRESALVEGQEGPLHEGALERFTEIGAEIAEALG
jgi:flavodoxin